MERRWVLLLAALLGLMVVASCAKKQPPEPAPPAVTPPPTPTQQEKVEPAKGEATEGEIGEAAETLEGHFKTAHEKFLAKDEKAAAEEIRKAGELVKQEADGATGETKEALTGAADRLGKLADDMEKGLVTDEQAVKHAFAQAHLALAEHHRHLASEHWAKNEAEKAGHELKTAVAHAEHAGKWLGQDTEAAGSTALKDARDVAGKLIEGTGTVTDDVGGIMDRLQTRPTRPVLSGPWRPCGRCRAGWRRVSQAAVGTGVGFLMPDGDVQDRMRAQSLPIDAAARRKRPSSPALVATSVRFATVAAIKS